MPDLETVRVISMALSSHNLEEEEEGRRPLVPSLQERNREAYRLELAFSE